MLALSTSRDSLPGGSHHLIVQMHKLSLGSQWSHRRWRGLGPNSFWHFLWQLSVFSVINSLRQVGKTPQGQDHVCSFSRVSYMGWNSEDAQ